MLATTVNLPTRRGPSPQIRARDTSLDGAENGSAGVNSAPNVDAGVNGATHLGGQHCRDHEDRGDGTDYRKLAEHNLSLPWVLNPSMGDYHGAPSSRWPWGFVALPHAVELALDLVEAAQDQGEVVVGGQELTEE